MCIYFFPFCEGYCLLFSSFRQYQALLNGVGDPEADRCQDREVLKRVGRCQMDRGREHLSDDVEENI